MTWMTHHIISGEKRTITCPPKMVGKISLIKENRKCITTKSTASSSLKWIMVTESWFATHSGRHILHAVSRVCMYLRMLVTSVRSSCRMNLWLCSDCGRSSCLVGNKKWSELETTMQFPWLDWFVVFRRVREMDFLDDASFLFDWLIYIYLLRKTCDWMDFIFLVHLR